ncbi:hypothetical protein MJO28_009394 [Puccinia striiformis f. sp. tritici]|uniref:Uncharacterized protein n=2 Tax=Puccinia striiformis f. sp. tritici TaxID=168172 RepID=A0A0L0VWX1_9BASI|nr:hypothetical protein Pst134EB_018631 [Puccinia striiformis f. sp. tritici]KAI7947486.1 hypothetical protein MJO28_009394 [Puccinia striiformis f. sp. tritici]KAI7950254.1 hypothetical protein MJO29_008928 [Puccinia striiformis f. sp. tritici]KNF03766.1 hypothetical protein PSTG_02860 [Puccinia striiformis f. sp. tritici PST-78]
METPGSGSNHPIEDIQDTSLDQTVQHSQNTLTNLILQPLVAARLYPCEFDRSFEINPSGPHIFDIALQQASEALQLAEGDSMSASDIRDGLLIAFAATRISKQCRDHRDSIFACFEAIRPPGPNQAGIYQC